MTTYIDDLVDLNDLVTAVGDRLVAGTRHPTLPFTIYNYTPAAQYTRTWTPVTRTCRGLIVDDDGVVHARPFPKFFNYGEDTLDRIPQSPPLVFDKLDGSLGIIYPTPDGPAVATRGSFTSDQAVWATEWLRQHHPTFAQPAGVTTLCEIVYPANRIVVDYGDWAGLSLLGAIDIATGADIDWWTIDWWDGERAEVHGELDIDAAHRLATSDRYARAEGVVLVWPRPDRPAFRLKVKHPDYVRLHRIVTGLSTRSVWEALTLGQADELITGVPDEFHPWLRDVIDDLTAAYTAIANVAAAQLEQAKTAAGPDATRGELAEHIKRTDYPGICFAMLDGKRYADRIWRMVKPDRATAMILDTEAAA